MNGKEICPVETVTVIVRAVLPWDSADGKDRIEICTHDRQSQIDYCLNHCPYAECVNCAGGGRTTSRGGRPPLLREAEMQKLRELLEARTDPADICREMHMDRVLKEIIRDKAELIPHAERYKDLKKVTYGGRK